MEPDIGFIALSNVNGQSAMGSRNDYGLSTELDTLIFRLSSPERTCAAVRNWKFRRRSCSVCFDKVQSMSPARNFPLVVGYSVRLYGRTPERVFLASSLARMSSSNTCGPPFSNLIEKGTVWSVRQRLLRLFDARCKWYTMRLVWGSRLSVQCK